MNELIITVECHENQEYASGVMYIASDEIFNVWGDGDTPLRAVLEYMISLWDYRELVINDLDHTYNKMLHEKLNKFTRLKVVYKDGDE